MFQVCVFPPFVVSYRCSSWKHIVLFYLCYIVLLYFLPPVSLDFVILHIK